MQFNKKGSKIYNRKLCLYWLVYYHSQNAPLLQDSESSGVFIMQRND